MERKVSIMDKKRKLLVVVSIIVVMLVGIVSVSYAFTAFKSNAEIVAGLTGKRVEEVTAQRQAGNSYGEQAAVAGKLAEFKAARLEQVELRLKELVEEKKLTQAEADARLKIIQDRMADCTGTGENQGQGGLGLGMGNQGQGCQSGTCTGSATGTGFGGGRGGRMGRSSS